MLGLLLVEYFVWVSKQSKLGALASVEYWQRTCRKEKNLAIQTNFACNDLFFAC